MDTKQIELDKELIHLYGGTTALAKKLGIAKQRVNNWRTRGIPASIKIKYPKLFLKKYTKKD
jgi:hypothetical protein